MGTSRVSLLLVPCLELFWTDGYFAVYLSSLPLSPFFPAFLLPCVDLPLADIMLLISLNWLVFVVFSCVYFSPPFLTVFLLSFFLLLFPSPSIFPFLYFPFSLIKAMKDRFFVFFFFFNHFPNWPISVRTAFLEVYPGILRPVVVVRLWLRERELTIIALFLVFHILALFLYLKSCINFESCFNFFLFLAEFS